MEIMKKDFKLNFTEDRVLDVSIYGIENIGKLPAIIITHGFRGFKDWGFFPFVAEEFSKKNFVTILFNFSGSGFNNETKNIINTKNFVENTYSNEIEELNFLINKYLENTFGEISNKKIFLIGFSRGALSVLANYSKFDEIKALTTWSGISKIDRFSPRQKEEWKNNGFLYVLSNNSTELLKISTKLLTEIEEQKINIEEYLKNQNKPYLIINGDSDLIVHKNEAEKLFNWSKKEQTKLEIIEKTNHFYNTNHPFEATSENLMTVIRITEKFFLEQNN